MSLRGEDFKAADGDQWHIGNDRKPLCGAAGDAEAGEGARPGAKGDGVESADADTGLGEQLAHQRQQGFGMRATGRTEAFFDRPVMPERAGTEFG